MATYIISVLNDPSTVGGTFAEGINDSGQVVGYYVDAGGHKHGFLYNGVTYTTLNYFVPHLYTGTDTVARDINDAGVIVGYTNVGISLGTTNPPSNIGGYTYSGGVFSLPISAANDTYTTGINNLSQITSYGADPFLNPPQAILGWVGSLATPLSTHFLDPAATAGTFAEDINNAGIAVGYYLTANATAHAFWEINGSLFEFKDIPNNNTIIDIYAFGINDAGQTVGYYVDNVGQFHGWIDNVSVPSFTTFDVPGATGGTFLQNINDAGQLVGYYSDAAGTHGFVASPPPPPPPAGTTADMVLRHGADGLYEIYDIGNNAILAGTRLGQVGTDWQFAGLGGFFGSDTTDMLLRSATTGGFEVYDISNNNITGAAFLGAVGMNWQVMGFGNFSGMPGESDMILRNANTGGLEVYDIANNQLTGAAFAARGCRPGNSASITY